MLTYTNDFLGALRWDGSEGNWGVSPPWLSAGIRLPSSRIERVPEWSTVRCILWPHAGSERFSSFWLDCVSLSSLDGFCELAYRICWWRRWSPYLFWCCIHAGILWRYNLSRLRIMLKMRWICQQADKMVREIFQVWSGQKYAALT